ncbi:MAG: transposase domain-containing protein [Verrucomicrobiia bacterium]
MNPRAYLTDVLRRLPNLNITQIGELLPESRHPPPAAVS